ncbi:MAG: hypothetical protein LBR31_00535 [Desulfovibrio sp.]|jgi:uncharacterized protein YfaS (alpha-2-macroglobulin family)|nr:hypothetical protein [Desulfovibrio sp.]
MKLFSEKFFAGTTTLVAVSTMGFAACLAVFLMVTFCGGVSHAFDGPASTGPKEAVKLIYGVSRAAGGQTAIVFKFSAAMVGKKSMNTPLPPEKLPVVFEPPLEGEGVWASPTELVFTSYKPAATATVYTFSAAGGKVKALNGSFYDGWAKFTPYPFKWERVTQTRYFKDGAVALQLEFTARVSLAQLRKSLKIATGNGAALAFDVQRASGGARDQSGAESGKVVVALTKPGQQGKLRLTLPMGFASEEGPQGLESPQTREVETTSMLSITTVRPGQSDAPPWSRHIQVETTNSADVDKVRQFLDIKPDIDARIEGSDSGFRIVGDFMNTPRVSLTFRKGMPGPLGYLNEDFTSTVIFEDFSPSVAIDAQGSILSPLRNMLVPVSTINVERVQATLWQLPPGNIPLMSQGFFDAYRKHLSRRLAVRHGTVKGARNRVTETALDLRQIVGKGKGVFLLTIANADAPGQADGDQEDREYESGQSSEKLVVISDLGVSARLMPDSCTVWVNSIATADAVNDAIVRVFAANNTLLAEGRTDRDGVWRHTRETPWDQRERPAIVLVSTDAGHDRNPSDTAYLKLDKDMARDSAFDTGGRPYLRQGYEAFCFTPRGVFRPGETVDFKTLVRDAAMRAPEPFPVAWSVRASTGRTAGQGTALLSAEGGAAFSLPLTPSAPTGKYTMSVSVPGQQIMGMCSFAVEDFQPPRIEVKLETDKSYAVGDETIAVGIDSAYLFGAPVADGPWEARTRMIPYDFRPASWKAYTFPSAYSISEEILSNEVGTLDAAGKGGFGYAADSEVRANIAQIVFSARVREDGGRWVGRNLNIPWFRTGTLLGYETPEAPPQAGAPCSVRVAAVTPDGQAAAARRVKAALELRNEYYIRSDQGYAKSVAYDKVAERDIMLEGGSGVFTFTPKQRGVYRLRFTEPESGAIADAELEVWAGVAGSGEGASSLVDRVMLSWDKPRYAVGETATLKIRAPFAGKLLLALEGGREIRHQVLTMTAPEMTVDVPVLQAMSPNAYCSAWVVRPVKPDEVWGAHRAFGLIPLPIDHSAQKLAVTVGAPPETLPNGELPVSVSLKDAQGRPARGEVALALVDEGLLALSNFAAPDPFAFFTAKRALLGADFDVYDDLMPLSQRKAMTLQAGGDGGGESFIAPMLRKLELLSLFLGTLTTDENGRASVSLKLPEYSGKGRIMAVAATASAVGSATAQVKVAREITIEATVPRMVAPGDAFTAPVLAFAADDKPRKAVVSITTEGPLALTSPKEYPITLDARNPRAAISLSFKAENASGLGIVRIVTTLEKGSPFEQRLEVPVRPPFPHFTRSGAGAVQPGQSAVIDVGSGFFKGTQKVTLAFSETPGIVLTKALNYLGAYPYGCLEQTISAAWPYIAAPAMLRSLDPEKAQDTEFRQGLDFAVRRILAMQRGDGGFNMWPGGGNGEANPWGSVYAAHFLTEAGGLAPEDAMKAALSWMRAWLATPLPEDEAAARDVISVKTYIAYVLALNNDAPLGWMQFLKDQGDLLSPSARIFLAGAYARATGKTEALRELGTRPLAWNRGCGQSYESAARNDALRLLMWAGTDPLAPETAQLALKVMDDGNRDRWYSTQENGMAALALGRYTEKTASRGKDFEATLSAETASGSSVVASFRNGRTPILRRDDLPPAPPENPLPVTLKVSGEAPAYYSWQSSGIPTAAPAPVSQGLVAARRWLLPDGQTVDFMNYGADGSMKNIARNVKVPQGARVTVQIYLKPEAALGNLVLTDIAPGGFEIDNPRLATGGDGDAEMRDPKTGKALTAPKPFGRPVSLNAESAVRAEIRDDRLLLFISEAPEKPSCFTYTLRAVSKGAFMLPPLAVEGMYDPGVKVVTSPGTVTVE